MIRSLYFAPDGKIRTDVTQGELVLLLGEENGVLWVDMTGGDRDQYKQLLETIFNFHSIAVDDALEQTHIPKVDDWGKYLYLVLFEIGFNQEGEELVFQDELDLFFGPGFMVTYHQDPIESLDRVWEICQRDPRYLKRGTPYLLYQVGAALVDGHLPVFDRIEIMIDELEDQILKTPRQDVLERIFLLKRALLHIRRMMVPQQEVFSKLYHDEYLALDKSQRYLFRNIYDHYVRLTDLMESLRELLVSSLEIHLSATNNRMNQVVKTLTIITTMFMPITFVTSFFGMNFFQKEVALNVWTGWVGLGVSLLFILVIPIVMFLWMRRRDWM